MKNKIIPFNSLHGLRENSHENTGIIHCHGVFDVLHAGHLAYFERARQQADNSILVVTVTSDKWVLKGPGTPVFKEDVRAKMLAALEIVDYVAISDHPTAIPAIEILKPNFYVKGQDYKDPEDDPTGQIVHEVGMVEKCGGKVIYTNEETHSSSSLANKFFKEWSDDQKYVISAVKDAGGLKRITEIFEEIKKLNVCVAGEPIWDIYRFVRPQNISSKSPSISAKFLRQEAYMGGATAIINHLKSFVNHVVTHEHDWSEIQKIRYLTEGSNQRIFEVTEIPDDYWQGASDQAIDYLGVLIDKSDVTLLADFGHGYFTPHMIRTLGYIREGVYVGLNVQTNSSNFGFNTFDKHNRFDYLVLDKREAQLALKNETESPIDLGKKISNRSRTCVSVTLGPNGAALFKRNDNSLHHIYTSPAFADQIVDATGAGDAYFAITTLLMKVGAPPIMVPFIGNVFAGLKAKIIGNKAAVNKADLMKALAGILK